MRTLVLNAAHINRRRALIVHTDPLVRRMITEVVTLQGFTPIIACTGEEGYGVLAEHAHTTALIIVGSALPDMDGTSFRQLQLDAPAVASIPTIILSGRRLDDEAAVRRQCGSVGAN